MGVKIIDIDYGGVCVLNIIHPEDSSCKTTTPFFPMDTLDSGHPQHLFI